MDWPRILRSIGDSDQCVLDIFDFHASRGRFVFRLQGYCSVVFDVFFTLFEPVGESGMVSMEYDFSTVEVHSPGLVGRVRFGTW
jgi:hypothetical protein